MSYEAGDRQNESERERKTTLESGRQKSERGRERENRNNIVGIELGV